MFRTGEKVVCFMNGGNYYEGNYVQEGVTCLVLSRARLVSSRTGKRSHEIKGDHYIPSNFIERLERPLNNK